MEEVSATCEGLAGDRVRGAQRPPSKGRVCFAQRRIHQEIGPDIDGEVIEATPPRRLVQTWRMLMDPGMAAEGFTRLTYEIEPVRGGVTKLTVTHDVSGAPKLASIHAGEGESTGAGGGWVEVLSGLKTLLETGAPLPFQSGPEKG